MSVFKLEAPFSPTGDQPDAIQKLVQAFRSGEKYQTLLGVTGSGKTFTMANVIERLGKKTLILAHNKTLAAQLFAEFKAFFPSHAVEYFVSYYDYYRPEAYIPGQDVYIEKDSAINDEIDKLRHACTRSLLDREDVIVIASVSCIYGIGSPEEYMSQRLPLFSGDTMDRDVLLKRLVAMQYQRNDIDFHRGTFRVRGDVVEIFPAHEDSQVVRVSFFGDDIDGLALVDPLRSKVLQSLKQITIYPKSHYVVSEQRLKEAIQGIKDELRERLQVLEREGKILEKERLSQRTLYDIEMLEEMGFCSGIENYSRHLTGRCPGEAAPTLIDFFNKDFLLIVDESHMTISQVGGMYKADRSRKETLVNYGFRLPSALDNRPLQFNEFEARLDRVLYVSATPANYELEKTKGEFVEQIIRPTGLLDPEVEVRDAKGQVDDLLDEVKRVVAQGHRVLVTTLTKKLSEDLTSYFRSVGVKVRYLHSEIETLERMEILRDLRTGEFDVLVGINLLREGLDLPEVALVAILDADKEGFLRSARSLIQTIGRAARNASGRVILYAYTETESMKTAIGETRRRRGIQMAYNEAHGITPKTIQKSVSGGVIDILKGNKKKVARSSVSLPDNPTAEQLDARIASLKVQMKDLSRELRFEEAARCRDEVKMLTEARLFLWPSD